CPNEAEIYNTFEDNDGCPDEKADITPIAREIKRGLVILRGVNFESGKDVLTDNSYVILDQVYASLTEWPEIKIEIRGHTDSVGSERSNRRLSLKRAERVREYLISKGISPQRLTPIGKGELEPIADNNTIEGRAINRRVELHRID
ncbi:MAG: OmpA family protein, partial [Chitinispirillia bacterium]